MYTRKLGGSRMTVLCSAIHRLVALLNTVEHTLHTSSVPANRIDRIRSRNMYVEDNLEG